MQEPTWSDCSGPGKIVTFLFSVFLRVSQPFQGRSYCQAAGGFQCTQSQVQSGLSIAIFQKTRGPESWPKALKVSILALCQSNLTLEWQ